jgi:hypothetical protein
VSIEAADANGQLEGSAGSGRWNAASGGVPLQRQMGGAETVKPILTNDPGLHPSLRRRVGAAAETLLLWGRSQPFGFPSVRSWSAQFCDNALLATRSSVHIGSVGRSKRRRPLRRSGRPAARKAIATSCRNYRNLGQIPSSRACGRISDDQGRLRSLRVG